MLGANVGTTLIVQVLSFNVSPSHRSCSSSGWWLSIGGAHAHPRLGRVAIGLGLMLLALHILLDTLAPAENAPGVRVFLPRLPASQCCA